MLKLINHIILKSRRDKSVETVSWTPEQWRLELGQGTGIFSVIPKTSKLTLKTQLVFNRVEFYGFFSGSKASRS